MELTGEKLCDVLEKDILLQPKKKLESEDKVTGKQFLKQYRVLHNMGEYFSQS